MHAPPGFRGAFRTDELARALYSEGAGIFRMVPEAVAVPADRDDLVCLVRWAREAGRPLVPRGAGSGMPGGNVGAGVVVDLTQGFRQPTVVDPERQTARAGAAVTYRELSDAAAAHGLRLAPDPASGAFCTLGGMVSTNAAGPKSYKHGAMRAWVKSVEFVTADGEVGRAPAPDAAPYAETAAERRARSDLAPYLREHQRLLESQRVKTRKNSSGYHFVAPDAERWVRELLVGSEGTLAFVTEVEVRLAPAPERSLTLLVPVPSLEHISTIVASCTQAAPEAVELLDRTYLGFVRALGTRVPRSAEAVLLVEALPEALQYIRMVGVARGVLIAEDPQDQARIWDLRQMASPILANLPDHQRSLQVVEDGCVPVDRLGDYVAGLRGAAERHGFEVVIFGHAGDGHVHANVLADVRRPDLAQRLGALLNDVTTMQIALSGTTSGEHGDGRLRSPFLERLHGAVHTEASRRLKRAFDPGGILNPGVKLPLASGATLDASLLKVGGDAPEIPAGAALALREIERTAGWGRFKLDLAPEPAPVPAQP